MTDPDLAQLLAELELHREHDHLVPVDLACRLGEFGVWLEEHEEFI